MNNSKIASTCAREGSGKLQNFFFLHSCTWSLSNTVYKMLLFRIFVLSEVSGRKNKCHKMSMNELLIHYQPIHSHVVLRYVPTSTSQGTKQILTAGSIFSQASLVAIDVSSLVSFQSSFFCNFIYKSQMLIIDPRGQPQSRPVVIIVFTQSVRPSVPKLQNQATIAAG